HAGAASDPAAVSFDDHLQRGRENALDDLLARGRPQPGRGTPRHEREQGGTEQQPVAQATRFHIRHRAHGTVTAPAFSRKYTVGGTLPASPERRWRSPGAR